MKRNSNIWVTIGFLLAISINAVGYDSLTIVKSFPSPTTGPRGLEYDGTYLYVAQAKNELSSDPDLIYKIDPSTGNTVEIYNWTLSEFPTGIAWDGSNFYVSDDTAETIYVVDENFNYIREFSSPETYQTDLAFDGTYLLEGTQETDKIWTLDPQDGSIISMFSSPLGNPSGIAWDGSNIWLANGVLFGNEDYIYKLNRNGVILEQYLSPGTYPTGLAFDGQYLWCVDWKTDMIYQLVPEPATLLLVGIGALLMRKR